MRHGQDRQHPVINIYSITYNEPCRCSRREEKATTWRDTTNLIGTIIQTFWTLAQAWLYFVGRH